MMFGRPRSGGGLSELHEELHDHHFAEEELFSLLCGWVPGRQPHLVIGHGVLEDGICRDPFPNERFALHHQEHQSLPD